MSEIIHSRTTGQYPLSIATSLAFESLAGIYPEKEVSPPPILKYEAIWVNIRTLIRNILGSIEKEQRKQLTPDELAEAIFNEMGVIHDIVSELHFMPITFYASDLDLSQYKYASLRKLKTENQAMTEQISVNAMGRVIKHFKNNPTELYSIIHTKLKLEPKEKLNTLILTNFPIDLTSYKRFKTLTLIESHTGALKERALWYTKYLNGQELTRLPFTEKLLQIFGDKETFSPLDKKLRDEILTIAEKYHWTPMTTEDKVNYGLQTSRNQYFIEYYRKL